jgi:hypothetical protein
MQSWRLDRDQYLFVLVNEFRSLLRWAVGHTFDVPPFWATFSL